MLFFTRWKAAAILLTALAVCLLALPNFFSENVIRHWPSWAQRHIVLGLDLQGGSHLLLEVDSAAVRKEQLQSINDEVLRVLRQARIPFTGRVIRGNSVEVRITRDTDLDNALAKLRELSQPVDRARRKLRVEGPDGSRDDVGATREAQDQVVDAPLRGGVRDEDAE